MGVQINATNFPDDVFREYIRSTFDKDNDGFLSDIEIEKTLEIDCTDDDVESLVGLEQLTNLKKLKVYYSGPNLTINGYQTIEYISLIGGDKNQATEINITRCPKLKEIDARWQFALITLDASDNPLLENIFCNGSDTVRSVVFQNCPSLIKFSVYGNRNYDSPLDFSECKNIEDFDCSLTKVPSLNFSGCANLKYVYALSAQRLSNINLTGCTSLRWICVEETALTQLVLPPSQLLHYLDAGDTRIDHINIKNNPVLVNLYNNVEPTKSAYGTSLLWIRATTVDETSYERDYRMHNSQPYGTAVYTYDKLGCYEDTAITLSEIEILQHPQDLVLTPNDEGGTVSVEAVGENLIYSWEVLMPGEPLWSSIDQDADASIYYVPNEISYDGAKFRCRVSTSSGGMVVSNEAIITVISAPAITQHPQSVTVTEGGSASFTVEASGTSPAYQWQSSTDDGETWTDIRGATGTTYQTTAALTMDGTQYRCQVSNTAGTVYTNAATLTVEEDTSIQLPVITQQPQSATVDEGNSATFTVTATGDDLHYQWQGNNTGTWFNITGETSASYTIAGTLGTSGMLFRCIVSNDAGAARSEEAMITVTPVTNVQTPSISYNPNAVTVQEGNTASFRVVAAGGDLAYQWQVNRDGSWYNISDATSASYSFKAALTDNGTYYRCLVSNSAGSVYSSGALLTVTAKPDVTPNKPTKINKYFLVNGYDILPFIKDRGIKWSRNDVDGDNAGRVLGNANMQRDRLAIKVRCDLECRPLGTAEIQRLLAAIEPVFVTVQQNIDPRIGTSTRVMYSNNATVVIGTVYDDENDLYEDLTFPLIEQ